MILGIVRLSQFMRFVWGRKSAPLIPMIPEILDFGNFFMLYVKCMNDRQS